jgi:hypothetical protein
LSTPWMPDADGLCAAAIKRLTREEKRALIEAKT